MVKKEKEKKLAIDLRKQGKTYSEILSKVLVAKSTLSLWLHDVGLAKYQAQRITEKRLEAARRGGVAKKNKRIRITNELKERARKEIISLSKREKWLIGIMLYWAEGSKEKEHNPGISAEFTNSDPEMIKVFVRWLVESCKVKIEELDFDIYIHETKKEQIELVKNFWSKLTRLPLSRFQKVYWKKHKPQTLRKNIGDLYYGNLRVTVKASSSLNRRISGWIKGVCEQYCRLV